MEIKFTNVSYQEFHHLTFSIQEGTLLGITGRGKTKFLKLLNGYFQLEGDAQYGNLEYNEKNLYTIRRKVNMIEQDFSNQFFLKTIEEYIAFLLQYYKLDMKDPKKKVLSAFKMVGLSSSYLKEELATLSASEQKLLQIAIALLSNPEVLILDEPFAKLDFNAQKKIKRLLLKLKERYHKTIIIASSNSDLLYTWTEEMFFLKNYTILKQGKTEELYQNVKFLTRYHYDIPEIILFTEKVKREKGIQLNYHKDIRDLIKDVYKHVE